MKPILIHFFLLFEKEMELISFIIQLLLTVKKLEHSSTSISVTCKILSCKTKIFLIFHARFFPQNFERWYYLGSMIFTRSKVRVVRWLGQLSPQQFCDSISWGRALSSWRRFSLMSLLFSKNFNFLSVTAWGLRFCLRRDVHEIEVGLWYGHSPAPLNRKQSIY
jgi:hypothetical protein